MQCPKCGHQQANTEECESCGIFFAKYKKLQQQPAIQPIVVERKRSNMLPIGITIILSFGIGAYLFSGSNPSTPDSPQATATTSPGKAASPANQPDKGHDLVTQLDASHPRNEIEKARNATVFIKTKWGLGSGFFFTRDCQLLTNRHVVELSEETVAKIQAEFDQRAAYLENVKLEIETRKREFSKRCRKCDGEEYRHYISEVEEKYSKAKQELSEYEDKLFALRHIDDISIIMTDGTAIPVTVTRVSEKYDLALLKLTEHATCPVLSPGNSNELKYGDTLFTIGNPVGLKLVVTSGVFSGYTKLNEVTMLQTDAPINPGNSGGPLIDNTGKVYGINTAILSNAEGIGFAIPIELAVREFGL